MHPRATLDTGDLRSRLRVTPITHRASNYQARRRIQGTFQPVLSAPRRSIITDFGVAPKPKAQRVQSVSGAQVALPRSNNIASLLQRPEQTTAAIQPQKPVVPARGQSVPVHELQPTRVLARSYVTKPVAETPHKKSLFRLSLPKLSQSQLIMTMALCVFLVGMGVSVMGFYANRMASAQALVASKRVDAATATAKVSTDTAPDSATPSTTPVSSSALKSYTVAPDLARYITIPSIGVHARVLQVGVTTGGALGTPANVFDTAWYTGSAKPGQAGATLIDGHVSSWTSNGVFYNLKKLSAGDQIQVEKGSGEVLTYTVKKVVAYDAGSVDMKTLMTAVDPDRSGLNLITCGGKYDSSSKEFTQRIAVFAAQQ